ncbi:MAG: cobalamin biosynthesis protein CbiM [Chlorobiaceae bacterium]|nr:cobalamin biosynthesis protein CbiM [Chlorobiaceae bacterium]
MHMSDALLSPVVGGALWVTSASLIVLSSKKIAGESDGSKTVLMGVLGAFVFAAQMINFTIPGTGSSGHIGGGLLLAVLLGPWRAFVTISSVLVIQALFFADGGLLALGCNIFNLGFFPAFVALPFIYRPVAGRGSAGRIAAASIIAAAAGLLSGAFSVVLETTASGISDLPFGTFLLFMLPIHLAIGIVEGLLTWGVLSFVLKTEPALLDTFRAGSSGNNRPVMAIFLVAALATGGVLSWFASSNPDGLEWSVAKVTGKEALPSPSGSAPALIGGIQEKLAFMPDYDFRREAASPAGPKETGGLPANTGTSSAGILGSLMVLAVAWTAGMLLRRNPHKSTVP